MIDLTYLFSNKTVPEHLQKAAEFMRSGKSLILSMPPRSGKTSLAGSYAKCLTDQGKKVLYITYNQWLADRLGGYAGCDAAGLCALSNEIGKEYDAILVDDILKGHQEAHDDQHVKMAVTWFDSVLYSSACKAETRYILIGSRWRENDFIGNYWDIALNDPIHFDIIALPAIIHDQVGSELSYWPEEYPLERLDEIRKSISSDDFKWLYQQGVE